jgi:rhamnulokinase
MTSPLYIAVDLGAGSGRVFLVGVDIGNLLFEEVRRFQYPPRDIAGHLRWDFSHILENVIHGFSAAADRARELGRPVCSIGVDSWGVDYGLLDSEGRLLADPVCYRDNRTTGMMERVFDLIPRSQIFEKTGIQFLNFNTLFQLCAEGEFLTNASRFLLLPDLINFFLTGTAFTEYTNATTTQMVNAAHGDWDRELIHRAGLQFDILPKIIPAGTAVGRLKADVAADTKLADAIVIAPATHDTASAVIAAPISDEWAYISSGTWSLVGVELDRPIINDAVAAQNFTNEGGAYGTVRFLKNVMGLWILERCRREWRATGTVLDYDELLREVNKIDGFPGFIFPDDTRFLNPASMTTAICEQLKETGQTAANDPLVITKVILDSLAFRYASVLQTTENLTSRKLRGIQVIGGGSRNHYLNQITANASRLKVRAGLTEATVMGNVLVQAISAGRFASLADARDYVSEHFDFEEFQPKTSAAFDDARRRYAAVESRFVE